jgi:hypothetical protein
MKLQYKSGQFIKLLIYLLSALGSGAFFLYPHNLPALLTWAYSH